MQQPAIRSALDFLFRGFGLFQGQVGRDRNIAVERAVKRVNALQHGLGQLDRRDFFLFDEPGNLGQRFRTQFGNVRHSVALLIGLCLSTVSYQRKGYNT